jgi:hypothetical protein
MGLTIHYTLSVKGNLSAGVVSELARRTAQYARKIGCANVSAPFRAEEDGNYAPLLFSIRKPKANEQRTHSCPPVFGLNELYQRTGLSLLHRAGFERASQDDLFGAAMPLRGWLVNVWPGAGCESAKLGLCQYPRRILFRGQSVPTGFKGGWQFQSFCKTQYAGEHGWETFLKCHLLVVSLLDFWRGLGVRVKVNDEGGYWETRSVKKLRAELGGYDRLVAAMGGMFKDACGEGDGLSVESPIFDYKNFERLEHEGRREFGGRIQQL